MVSLWRCRVKPLHALAMSKVTDQIDQASEEQRELPKEAMVVTSHPRAVEAATKVLEAGGHAVDAAICAAAVLGVVDPMSTGVGGDCFAMVWDAHALHGFNGSGRAPAKASLEDLRARGLDAVPERGVLPITVPGAVDAWWQLHQRFGRASWDSLLEPAVVAARDGFAVTPVVGRDWGRSAYAYQPVPQVGQVYTQLELAQSLEKLQRGRDVFYSGELADAIAARVAEDDGWLTKSDLEAHQGEWVEPLEGVYRGHPVYELPPNGQGVVVLQALAMLEELSLRDMDVVEQTHVQIEALKLAFADARVHVGDPSRSDVSRLLDYAYIEERVSLIGDQARASAVSGLPNGDTVYVAVVDAQGNACSLINSVYMHFGSGVVVDGMCLQNRGVLFRSDPAHPSALAPGRRPYHTIIPAMAFRGLVPWLVFGVVGGYQQPQAQVQLLHRWIDRGEGLQAAVDAPRFRWIEGNKVQLEEGTDPTLIEGLRKRGHDVVEGAAFGGFGGAQAIEISESLTGATDPRKDGTIGVLTLGTG